MPQRINICLNIGFLPHNPLYIDCRFYSHGVSLVSKEQSHDRTRYQENLYSANCLLIEALESLHFPSSDIAKPLPIEKNDVYLACRISLKFHKPCVSDFTLRTQNDDIKGSMGQKQLPKKDGDKRVNRKDVALFLVMKQ